MTSRHISAIFSVLLSLFFAGCADTRAFTDVVGGAGGALIANKLSHGNPWITAAGAGGGILASEAFHYASEKQSGQSYLSGYDKGRSDSAKQQYWLMVDRNKDDAAAQANVHSYEIPLPEQTVDGAILNPTTKVLRIAE